MGVFWECETCFEQHDELRDAKRCCDNRKAALEERAAIVAWLREQAALSLNHDMDLFDGFDQEKLEFSVTVTEDYANAVEAGEHLK